LVRGQLVVPFSASADPGAPPVQAYVVKCVGVRVVDPPPRPTATAPRVPQCSESGPRVFTSTVPAGATPLQATLDSLPSDDYACFAVANNGIGGDLCSSPSTAVAATGPRFAQRSIDSRMAG
jgi:hypothetical protein